MPVGDKNLAFVSYAGATLRQRVEAAYYVFHEWRDDNEKINRIFNVTQMMAFLDHDTAATFVLLDVAHGGRFVGMVSVMVEEPQGFLRNRAAPEHWICNVFVHKGRRGQGYGSRLLTRAEEHIAAEGATQAHLWCEAHLLPFYEARGWIKNGDVAIKPGAFRMTKTW